VTVEQLRAFLSSVLIKGGKEQRFVRWLPPVNAPRYKAAEDIAALPPK
jgi:hypothetical protein